MDENDANSLLYLFLNISVCSYYYSVLTKSTFFGSDALTRSKSEVNDNLLNSSYILIQAHASVAAYRFCFSVRTSASQLLRRCALLIFSPKKLAYNFCRLKSSTPIFFTSFCRSIKNPGLKVLRFVSIEKSSLSDNPILGTVVSSNNLMREGVSPV